MGKNRVRRAGIDVSAKTLHVAVEGVPEVKVFDNTADGHKTLLKSLTKRGAHADVVVEATGTYHLDLALALNAHERCRVMVANPRLTKHFHLGSGIRAKTDTVDCRALLQYAIRMDFVEWTPPSDAILQVRAITRYVNQMVKQQTRLKNQLHAMTVHSVTPQWIVDEAKERLQELAARIERARDEAVRVLMTEPELKGHIERLTTMGGLGKTSATKLLAEFPALDCEMTSKQITAWAGLDPRPRRSGTSLNGKTAISKHGSARIREALYMPAVTAARMDGPLKDFYDQVLDSSGHKMVAITALMRKMLVIAWAMYRTQTAWDAEKARPRQSVSAAA